MLQSVKTSLYQQTTWPEKFLLMVLMTLLIMVIYRENAGQMRTFRVIMRKIDAYIGVFVLYVLVTKNVCWNYFLIECQII